MKTALLLLALFFSGHSTQAPTRVQPPFSSVQGAFFALSVADIEASAKWYQEKLGLKVDKRDATPDASVCILSGNGLLVELIQQRNSLPLTKAAPTLKSSIDVHGIFKSGLIVDNIDAVFKELKARNVEIAFGMFPAKPDSPYKNFAIRDNSGNLIQFFGR
jgi:catechol 2,3-dioxygenase-like lactoylglutathione lyase family enzyme